jgi:hypothetical protein
MPKDSERGNGNGRSRLMRDELKTYRAQQARCVADAMESELALAGVPEEGVVRALLEPDVRRWLSAPRIKELPELYGFIASVNRMIAGRKSERRLTLLLRLNHPDSKWTQDFIFCNSCELIPPWLKEKKELSRLKTAIEACERTGRKKGLVMLHSHRVTDVCAHFSSRLFNTVTGVQFAGGVGPRLHEQLVTTVPRADIPFCCCERGLGDLLKVTFNAGVLVQFGIATVNPTTGAELAVYVSEADCREG